MARYKKEPAVKAEVPDDRVRLHRLRALDAIVERSPMVVFLWRLAPGHWPVELVTRNVKALMGYTASDFTSGNVSWPGVTDPGDVPRLEAEVATFLKNGTEEWVQEYRVITKSGTRRWVRDWNRTIRDASGTITHVQGMLADITHQKVTQEALERTNRALRFLTEVNRVLIRAESEQDLLRQTCEVILTGGYRMAWIGPTADRDCMTLVPARGVVGSKRTGPLNDCVCPTSREALRTRRPCICGKTGSASRCSTCRRKALGSRAVSAIALPLMVNGGNLGTLCLRSERQEPFDQEEVCLLMQLANDFAFGIHVLRSREERTALERELMEISEREQRRIGQDLHDTVGQSIAGIQYLLSATQQKLAAGEDGIAADLKYITKLVFQTGIQTHKLSRSLVPQELRSGQLIDALGGLAEHTRSIYSINCHVVTRLKDIRIPDLAVAGQLFRIAQEAVNNAARHSGTHEIQIHVLRPDGRLTLVVRDFGAGVSCRNDTESRGLGLRIMRHRAELIGAALQIETEPGKGTTVTCKLHGEARTLHCPQR